MLLPFPNVNSCSGTDFRAPESLSRGAQPLTSPINEIGLFRASWCLHLINLTPFLLLTWFVSRFSTNVPIIDEWAFAPLFHHVKFGKATFSDFFNLYNEHRLFFPHLLWTPLAFVTHWNLRVEMIVNLIPALSIFAVFYVVALRQAERTNSNLLHLTNFTTSLFLFSLVQHGTWLWGEAGAYLLVQASVALAIGVCFIVKLNPWLRFTLAAWFCVVASFSSAQGLLSWIALLPCIAVLQIGKHRSLMYCLWGLLFAASLALYTYHFRFTQENPGYFLSHPLEAAAFFLASLAAPFFQREEVIRSAAMADVASVIGAGILLAFSGCLALLSRREPKDILAPWFSVGLFGLLFAGMVTAGRSNEGAFAAMQSRYVTGTIFVSIATLQLGRLVCSRKGTQIYLFFVGALSALIVLGSMASLSAAQRWKRELSQAKLFVELIPYLDPAVDDYPESRLFPLYPGRGIRPAAGLLNELGFIHLASNVAFAEKTCFDCGAFESADGSGSLLHLRQSKDELTVSGWTSLPRDRGLPKVVLISYGEEKTFIMGAVVGIVNRPDIATLRRDPRYLHAGWKVSFPAKFLPLGEGTLKAWVYDAAEKEFIPIPESGRAKQFKVETP